MSIPPRNNKKESQPPSPSPNHNLNFASSSSFSDNFSSPPSMEPLLFPPGYSFVQTDEVIILRYLKAFLQGKQNSFPNIPIHRVNIYESTPQQLSKEYDEGNDKEWFFITERTKMSEGGTRQIRSDNGGGSWRETGEGKKIEAGHGVVGYITSLEYYIGRVKGDWLMQEYSCHSDDHNKVDYDLCKIYLTPKAAKRIAEEADNEKKKNKKRKMTIEEAAESLSEVIDQPQQEQTPNQVPLDEFDKIMNDFLELINDPPPEQVIPNNDDDMPDLYPQLLEVNQYEESNNGYLEDILTQGLRRRHTDEIDEMINMSNLYPQLPDQANNRYEVSNNGYLEDIVRQGMKGLHSD